MKRIYVVYSGIHVRKGCSQDLIFPISEILNTIKRHRIIMKVNKEQLFKKIISLIKKHGAKKIAVFGSYARGEEKPKSDIDILVEFSERKSLLDLVGIEQELSDTLGIKVDLLTEKSISPYLIGRIKKEMKVIYE